MTRFLRVTDERGQTMAEYSIVLTVISAGIVLALTFLSEGIAAHVQRVASYLH